jgi:glutathione S-transferase
MRYPIELYSAPLCPFAHRTRLTLAEKGLAARVIEVDLLKKPPGFGALTPSGEVPVLKMGDDCIWDSAVIDEFLEQVAPEPALLPEAALPRARARIWIRFADRRLYFHTKRLLVATDPDERGAAMATVREDLRFMQENAFVKNSGPYWMGDRMTLVDLTFIPWFEQAPVLESLLGFAWPSGSDSLRKWYEHVSRRPCVEAQSRPPQFYLQEYRNLMQRRELSIASTRA